MAVFSQLEWKASQRLGEDQHRLVGSVTSMKQAVRNELLLIFWECASIPDLIL